MLTPVENHGGLWLKREDHHRLPNGVNGAKLRACQHLIGKARERGYTRVVSAASVLSPQNAMAATVAAQEGMGCDFIVGGTRPDSARKHVSVQIAEAAGAHMNIIKVGYNPALQSAAHRMAGSAGAYHLSYGITVPPGSPVEDVAAFHAVGADQVMNVPDEVETLVVPFGSGNTAAGVLCGLSRHKPAGLRRVVLMGIGPDRQQWLAGRLDLIGVKVPVPVEHVALHPWFATYGDRMRYTLDGVVLHPTYEGKIATWADRYRPEWWVRRDGTVMLWVVGGPLR